MADTWAVKMEDTEKDELIELISNSDFDTKKEFMTHLVNLYKLDKSKNSTPILKNDIDELQKITSRISNIFIGVGERINTLMSDKDIEYQNQLLSKENLIQTLQNQISEYKNKCIQSESEKDFFKTQNKELEESLVNLKDDINERVYQYNKVNQVNEEVISQYKEKNDTLAGLVNEYKEYKVQNTAFKETIEELKNTISELKENNTELTHNNELLNNKFLSLDETYEFKTNQLFVQIDNIKSDHESKLNEAKKYATFEKEKALLELKTTHQDELQELQDKYNIKVQELLNKLQEISDEKKPVIHERNV